MEKANNTFEKRYWDKFFGFNRNLLNRGWKLDAYTLKHSHKTGPGSLATKVRIG